jgi:transcriptional regulator with XRE-family HTH domain
MLPFLNSTGKRIRILRDDLGYSQGDLVQLLQEQGIPISQSALSRCERDETGIDGRAIAGLAKLFGVTTDYLLMLTDIPSQEEEEEEGTQRQKLNDPKLDAKTLDLVQRLIAAFTELSTRDQTILLRMAETMRQANIPHIIGED